MEEWKERCSDRQNREILDPDTMSPHMIYLFSYSLLWLCQPRRQH